MRLKTITAATMTQAMAALRAELGDDAIIVSTETLRDGVKIVAALEEPDPIIGGTGGRYEDTAPYNSTAATDPVDQVHEALMSHGLPNALLERLVDASFLAGTDEPVSALAGALGRCFAFQNLTDAGRSRPIILIGTPGVGKTVTAAKLAARAVLGKRRVRMFTTDTVRAGAVEQLQAFARVLALPFATAETDRELALKAGAIAADELVLIDTAGVNPYSTRDMAELAGLVKAIPAEPVLVMAAGGDVVDAMELAHCFRSLGVARLLATRLDMARRLGSLLAAADAAGLALTDYGMTPSVAGGLARFEPISLAKMLMPQTFSEQPAHVATRGMRL
jgi:flagellar biosynthesis protein FlhF